MIGYLGDLFLNFKSYMLVSSLVNLCKLFVIFNASFCNI